MPTQSFAAAQLEYARIANLARLGVHHVTNDPTFKDGIDIAGIALWSLAHLGRAHDFCAEGVPLVSHVAIIVHAYAGALRDDDVHAMRNLDEYAREHGLSVGRLLVQESVPGTSTPLACAAFLREGRLRTPSRKLLRHVIRRVLEPSGGAPDAETCLFFGILFEHVHGTAKSPHTEAARAVFLETGLDGAYDEWDAGASSRTPTPASEGAFSDASFPESPHLCDFGDVGYARGCGLQ